MFVENYEIEIKEIIFKYLNKLFNINNSNEKNLYIYVKRRFLIENKVFEINNFIDYVFNLLNIDYFQKVFIKTNKGNIEIKRNSDINNIYKIFEELEFLNGSKEDKLFIINLNKEVKKKINKKNVIEKKLYFKLSKTYEIFNEKYGLSDFSYNTVEMEIKEFVYSKKREDYIYREIELNRYKLDLILFKNKKIYEKTLEDYLINNLNQLEIGLALVGRQIRLEEGIIDILAKDKNGKYTIIELKIENDTDIIWQRIYYEEEIKKKYGVAEIRFIVIANEIKKSIFNILKQINTEIYLYDLKTYKYKIEKIKYNKIL